MLRLVEAIAQFKDACMRGKVPNRKKGGTTTLSAADQAPILSSVRSALRRGTGLQDVDQVDITPFMQTLPELARQYVEAAGQSRPGNAADRVRRFLATIEGRTYKRARAGAVCALPDWRALHEAVAKYGKARHGRASDILRLQNVALLAAGIQRPEDLPSWDVVTTWAQAQQWGRGQIRRMLEAYCTAREDLAKLGRRLPDVRSAYGHERGLHGFKDIAKLVASRGAAKSAFDMDSAELIAVIAPHFSEALAETLNHSRFEQKGEEWKRDMRGAVSRYLAELLRLGYDPSSMTPYDLVSQQVEADGDTPEISSLALRELERLGMPLPRSNSTSPLLSVLTDNAARASAAHSPLRVFCPTRVEHPSSQPASPALSSTEPGRVDFYSETVQDDLGCLETLVRTVYAPWEAAHPRAWISIVSTFAALHNAIKEHNKGKKLTGHKDKHLLLRTITYPLVVCVGLPALRREVLKMRRRYQQILMNRAGKHDCEAVIKARRSYAEWLRNYLILAIIIDDGLRLRNYTGGIVGTHFKFVVDSKGKLDYVETCWRGYDEGHVKLKVDRDENGGERTRVRRLSKGIVDHELLWEFVTVIRPCEMVETGKLSSVAKYKLKNDTYALFYSVDARNPEMRYSTDTVSTKYGQALYWVCKHVLKRELPSWKEIQGMPEWRGLFGAHGSRLLIATYWGSVRQDWSLTMVLTDDTLKMLGKAYAKPNATLVAAGAIKGRENPHFFDAVLDDIVKNGSVVWFDDLSPAA
ncbi:MAG: hypothetical protein U0133_16145 [Gemmatimonadales bacterium]